MSSRCGRTRGGDPLTCWLREKGYWVPANAGAGKQLTHVFLNGGKASVPDASLDAFAEKYAEAVACGYPQYAVERTASSSGRFRMFMDIDLKAPGSGQHPPDEDALCVRMWDVVDDVVRAAAESVASFSCCFPSPSHEIIVCVKTSGQQQQQQQDGVHLVWPGSSVDASLACRIRDVCVQSLTCSSSLSIEWNRVIDKAVYMNNGLRMILSRKKQQPCSYSPARSYHVNSSTAAPDQVQSISYQDVYHDLVSWVKKCSVRIPASLSLQEETPSSCQAGGQDEGMWSRDYFPSVPTTNQTTGAEVSQYSEELKQLQAMLPLPYRVDSGCRVTGIKFIINGPVPRAIIYVTSRHCMNLQRQHRSNRVYLVADTKAVYQRCFCTCDTLEDRKYGPCHDACVPLLEEGTDRHPLSDMLMLQGLRHDEHEHTHGGHQRGGHIQGEEHLWDLESMHSRAHALAQVSNNKKMRKQ